MKNLIIIVIFGYFLTSASAVSKIDEKLRGLVEIVRQQMPCGFPSAGIPPLDPYTKEHHQFNVSHVGMDLSANLTNLTIFGIPAFEVKELNFQILSMKINFDVIFNQIKFFSQYQAKGSLQVFGKALPLLGDGNFDLIADKIRLNGSFHLRPTSSNGLKIYNYKNSFNMDAVRSSTTGILNSPFYSRLFNTWIEEFFGNMSEDYKEQVGKSIASYVVPRVNEQLEKVSPLKIVAAMFGAGSRSELFPVCEV